ncbi:hypothetical protein [Marivirga sp.]|uniref:hypothetical protein n=1 Tax=Marivirga sp. TaxID=2018662 RepID=UPI002D80ED32|nr:hypothetical protein [Marivirga sp.]HET8859840.1 hypothetical protein [Marivirga sp.]
MKGKELEKSQRINLGTGNIKFSERTIIRVNYLFSVLFLVAAILYLVRDEISLSERVGMSGLYLFTGLIFFIRAHIELSTTSKFAPHFIISEKGLKIKTGVFKKSDFIDWGDVKKVELGHYKIGIQDKTGLQFYPYQTRKETSINLKNSIQAMAIHRGIEVENLLKR